MDSIVKNPNIIVAGWDNQVIIWAGKTILFFIRMFGGVGRGFGGANLHGG